MSSGIAYICNSRTCNIRLSVGAVQKLIFLNKSCWIRVLWISLPGKRTSSLRTARTSWSNVLRLTFSIAAHTQALYGKWLPICLPHTPSLQCHFLQAAEPAVFDDSEPLPLSGQAQPCASIYKLVLFFEQPCTVSESWHRWMSSSSGDSVNPAIRFQFRNWITTVMQAFYVSERSRDLKCAGDW